jgi:hypothetical protein
MAFCVTIFDTIEDPSENEECFVTSTNNLTLNKGSAYKIIYRVTKNGLPADLTGYSLRGQIRPSPSSNEVLLNMTSANLLLQIDLSTSSLVMNLTETFTRRVSQSFAYYDIELINSQAQASKVAQGLITFVPEVTR